MVLQPHTAVEYHWPDGGRRPLLQFQNVSVNSFWSESVTFSLGEQLVGIATPEGMPRTPDEERVLRLYTATHNHQTVMTLEYAVGLRVVFHTQDDFSTKLYLYQQSHQVTPEIIKSMLMNKPIPAHPEVFTSPLGRAFSKVTSVFRRKRSPRQLRRMETGGSSNLVPPNSGYAGTANSGGPASSTSEDPVTTSVKLSIKGVGVSLLNSVSNEMFFLVVEGIYGECTVLESRKILAGFSLTRLQIDNSLPDTHYPVLLGSPIHNPLFNSDSTTEVDRERTLTNALVNVRRGPERSENARNQVIQCVVSIPYHPSVIVVEQFDLQVQVAFSFRIHHRKSIWRWSREVSMPSWTS